MNFIEFLEKHPHTRRIFGKKELEIIKKQLNGILLTQSERNRLSRDIKPKLKFIADCVLYSDKFDLKQSQANWELIKEAVDIILKDKEAENVKAILLFGSMVTKEMTYRSDIDISVVFKRHINENEAGLFRIRILGQTSDKVDVQVFNVLPLKIKKEIVRKHKVLYKDESFDDTDFVLSQFKNYIDFEAQLREAGVED